MNSLTTKLVTLRNVLILAAFALPAKAWAMAPLAATISGRILTEANSDVIATPGALVYALRPGGAKNDISFNAPAASTTSSLANGNFTLTVGPGKYVIFARHANGAYADEYWRSDAITEIPQIDGSILVVNQGRRNSWDEMTATVLQINSASDAFSDVKVYLAPGGTLWGCLKNPVGDNRAIVNTGSYPYSAAGTLLMTSESTYLRCMAREVNTHNHHITPLIADSRDSLNHTCFVDPAAYPCPYPGTHCIAYVTTGNLCDTPWGGPGAGTPATCTNTGSPPPYQRIAPRALCDLRGLAPGKYQVLVFDTRAKYRIFPLGDAVSGEAVTSTTDKQLTPAYTVPANYSPYTLHAGDGGLSLLRYDEEAPNNDSITAPTNLTPDARTDATACCGTLVAGVAYEYKIACAPGVASCTALTPGGKASGIDVDHYKIRAKAGQRFVIGTTSPFRALGPTQWPLVDTFIGVRYQQSALPNSGQTLAFDDDSAGNLLSQLEMTFPDNTDYIISVTTYGDLYFNGQGGSQNNGGDYGLRIERKPSAPALFIDASTDNNSSWRVGDWVRVRAGSNALKLRVVVNDPDANPNDAASWPKDPITGQDVRRLFTPSVLPPGAEFCAPRNVGDPCLPPDDQDHGTTEIVGELTWSPAPGADVDSPYSITFNVISNGGTIERKVAIIVDGFNRAPEQPSIIFPENNQSLNITSPVIRAQPTTDPDNDSLFYFFRLEEEGGPDLMQSGAIVAGPVDVQWTPSHPLLEDHRYKVKVWAFDGTVAGPHSPFVSFSISTSNGPPGLITITKPTPYGAKVAEIRPMIESTKAVDPEGNAITYRFELHNDPAVGSGTLVVGQDGVTPPGTGNVVPWSPNQDLEAGKTYYVRARAIDQFNNVGPYSTLVRFDIISPETCPDCPPKPTPGTPFVTPKDTEEPEEDIEIVASVPAGCNCASGSGAGAEVAFLALAMLAVLRLIRRRAPVLVRRDPRA